jgi:hypothetical protein
MKPEDTDQTEPTLATSSANPNVDFEQKRQRLLRKVELAKQVSPVLFVYLFSKLCPNGPGAVASHPT